MNITTNDLYRLLQVIEAKEIYISEAIMLISHYADAVINPTPIEGIITLTVDYNQTINQMVAAGNYDWKNSDITEDNFPLPTELLGKKMPVPAKLLHFNRDISSEDAISEMERTGYRSAILSELLALGKSQPDLQRKFPINALGSVWRVTNGDRFVPVLRVDGQRRELNLLWLGRNWRGDYHFLAVCKCAHSHLV